MGDKVVLEEEQYVEALERIIERDFFPDLPALRDQHQRLHTDEGSAFRAGSVATTAPRNAERRRIRSPASTARGESSSWDQPTPTRVAPVERDASDASSALSRKQTGGEGHVDDMTLNRFVATHTSEDNAAFTELQEKAVEDHKRRYHWAYDDDESKGDAKLHLLSNGEWISKERRRIVDQVLAPEGDTDTRPKAPDTWPFRARNALLFVPDLEASNAICKVEKGKNTTLSLESGDRADATYVRAIVKHNPSDNTARPRGKGETVYANSRFRTDSDETTGNDPSSAMPQTRGLDLVQMTPQIAPGVDASPLMTWGDIEGTPMILDARGNPDQVLNGPRFTVRDTSTREKIASRLESQSRMRKTQSRQLTPTPLIMRGKRPIEQATPSRAESIRSRLSSVRSIQRTPLFGSNSELRASYATPLLPPRHTKSRAPKK